MQIIKVELLNEQALKLLQQLEDLKILRLVGTKSEQPELLSFNGSKDEMKILADFINI
jgi:hypothetical protein